MADSPPVGDKCPLCEEMGRNGTLELRQINAYEALRICENPKCPYPVHLGVPTVANFLPELLEPPTPPYSPLTTQSEPQTTALQLGPTQTTSKPNGPTNGHLQSNGTNPTPNLPVFQQFPVSNSGHVHSSFSTSSTNFSSFYSSPSFPHGSGFSAVDSLGPACPVSSNAQSYPPMEYRSMQEEFDALFEDDVSELFVDPPRAQAGHHY